MTDEQRLIEKLQRIEALFAGAATPGEREAAAAARERIRARLRDQQQSDPPVELFARGPKGTVLVLESLIRSGLTNARPPQGFRSVSGPRTRSVIWWARNCCGSWR